MPISFTVASTAPGQGPRRHPRGARHRRPHARARRRRGRGRRSRARSPRSWSGRASRARPASRCSCRSTARPRARSWWAWAPADDVTLDGLRTAAALVAQRASGSARVATTLADAAPDALDAGAVGQAIAEGVLLGSYSFDEYRATKKATKIKTRHRARRRRRGRGEEGRRRGARSWPARSAWARDMVNTPARELTPDQFAKAAQQLLRGKNVKVEVLDVAAMKRLKLGGVLGVGQGSKQPPRLVKMTYSPPRAKGSHRARRQGRGVRLRRSLAQDRRGHGDDEDRHGRRGRGHRGDVGAVRARRHARRSSATRRWSRTCRAATRSVPATCSPSATARPPRCSTPTPRAG